jgi:phosphatidylglycerophosphatase C
MIAPERMSDPGSPRTMPQEPPMLTQDPPPGIALFDLDGTLLPWDCQLLFRQFVTRREPWRLLWLPLFLAALPLAPLLGNTRMKRVYFSFLCGMKPETLARHSRDFAQSAVERMYPQLLGEIERHRAAGHCLILSSASPECYVIEIGRTLGFHRSFGTQMSFHSLFPALTNHKGEAKTRRLREELPASWFSPNGQLSGSHGYSDSRADLPMLFLCKQVTLVNPSTALTSIGEQNSWSVIRPPLPWNSRISRAWQIITRLFGFGR